MKTKLLFSTLFATALFTACTSEELLNGVAGEEAEVVGAELLSKGLSFELGTSAETRIADEKWQKGDMVGLGWFVNGSYGAEQTYTRYGEALLSPMAINHRFFHDGEKFQSSSNIYKGWHMAYSPYAYTEQANKDLIIPMNAVPQAVADYKDDQLANRPAISAKDFLAATKINKETGMITTKYDLYFIANQWSPRLAVDAFFSGQEYLKNLKVKYVTVRTTEGTPFQDAVKIDPKQAPSFIYAKWNKDGNNGKGEWIETDDFTKDAPYNEDMTKLQFVNAIFGADKAIQPNGTAVDKVTRNIASTTGFKLDTDQNRINMFFNPVEIAVWTTLVIEVGVDQGKFVLAYVEENKDKEPYKSMSDADKAAQQKVNKALKYFAESMKNGVIAKDDKKNDKPAIATGAYGAADGALALTKKDFYPDFENISSVSEWNKAIALYDALGYNKTDAQAETFTLTGDIAFTDGIAMPANGNQINVTGAKKMVINGTITYPAKLNTDATVNLEVKGTLNVASTETFNQVIVNKNAILNLAEINGKLVADETTNMGTINVGKAATLETTTLTNEGEADKKPVYGIIDVVYGSYVKTQTTDITGIIQYTLTNDTKAFQINNLVDAVAEKTARVNTLVIPAGITLDLNAVDKDAILDPYTGVNMAGKLNSLENVDIVIDGGILIGDMSTNEKNYKVKNVIARTLTNQIKQITAKNITINKDAVLGIYNDTGKLGEIQVVAEGTVTNKGTVTFSYSRSYAEKDKKVTDVGYACHQVTSIINNGELTVYKVHLNANTITNNESGTLTAKKVDKDADSQIRCTTLTNNGTVTGDVMASN